MRRWVGLETTSATLVVAATLVVGCSSDNRDAGDADGSGPDADAGSDGSGTDAGSGATSRVDYTLAEEAVLLEGEALSALIGNEGSGNTLVFDSTVFETLGVEVDSVLVAGVGPNSPYGLLRRVTAIEDVDGSTRVSTTQAALTDAFAALDLELRESLTATDLTFDEARPLTSSPKDSDSGANQLNLGGPFEWIVFDGDDDPTTDDDQVRVDGTISATAGYYFGLSYSLGVLDSLLSGEFPPDIDPTDIDLRAGFSINAAVVVDVTLSGRAALGFEKEVLLGEHYLAPIAVGPLVFLPVVRAIGTIEGSVPGSFAIHAGATAGFGASVEYVAGDGYSDDFTEPYLTPVEPSADVELGASAEARIDVEVALLLYGIIGPQAGIGAYAKAEANVFDDPCWRASVGLDAYLGLLVELFTIELADWEKHWPIAEVEIGSGSCETGQAVDPGPPWSRAWVDSVASVAGSDAAVASLSPAIDGNFLLSGSGSLVLSKLSPEGVWLWARSFVFHGVLETPIQILSAFTRTDGGIIATGRDNFVLRLDAAGQLESAVVLETDTAQPGEPLASISDGANGAWIAATQFTEASADYDVVLLHAAADGTAAALRWGRPEWDERPRALVNWNGRIAMLAVATNYDAEPDSESWLLLFDAHGALTATHRFTDCAGVEDVALNAMAVAEDGNLVVGGYGRFSAPRAILASVRPDGSTAWTSAHASGDLLGYSVSAIEQLDGGAYLIAGTRLYAAPDDVFVARTDAVGNIVWVYRFGGSGWEVAPALALLPDGNALMATASTSFGDLQSSWWASRFDARTGVVPLGADAVVSSSSETFGADGFCVSSSPGSAPSEALAVDVVSADVDPMPPEFTEVVLSP